MFFGPNMQGTCLCVFWTQWGYFFGPACICAGPRGLFSTAKLIVSELGFLFFGPVHLLPGPCLHRVGGELHCYRRSHWAGSRARFFDLAQGGGNLDTETRCMQEVVDAGEVPVLKQ